MGEFGQKQQYPERTPPYSRRMGEDPYTDEKVSCVGEEPDFLQEKLSSIQFEYDGTNRMQIKDNVFEPYTGITYENGIVRVGNIVGLGGVLAVGDTTIGGSGQLLSLGTNSDKLGEFNVYTGSDGVRLDVGSVGRIRMTLIGGMEITDLQVTKVGIVYTADYSANFTDRSLVDKGWVVTSIAAHTGLINNPHTVTKAQVGLSDVTNNAQVKKLGSSTVGNVPTWSVTTGDALADTYGVETTLVGDSGYLARADAIKAYVDGMSVGLQVKDPCRVATTANIDLDGLETIDDISVIADDRVYVKDQTLTKENGLYLCKAGAWVRIDEANTWAELVQAYAMIQEGTINAGSSWVCNISSGGVLGTDPIPVTQFFDVVTYSAGNGLDLTGTQFSVDIKASSPGLEFVSGELGVIFAQTDTTGTSYNAAHSDHSHPNTYDLFDYFEITADSGSSPPIGPQGTFKIAGGGDITTSIGTGIVTITFNASSTSFTDLSDTPGSYATHGNKWVCVNTATDGLEFILKTFISLDDTPASWTASANDIVMVNGAGDALSFMNQSTAFNKNFGTGGTEVASGNHLHTGVYDLYDNWTITVTQSVYGDKVNKHPISKTEDLEIKAGTGVGLAWSPHQITISNTGTTYDKGSGIEFTGIDPTVISVKPTPGDSGGLEVSGSGVAIKAEGVKMAMINGPVTVAKGGTGRISLLDDHILIGNAGGIIECEEKNTAFNKDFGTSAGTVAEGNSLYSSWTITATQTTYGDLVDKHPISSGEDLEFKAGMGISLSWSPHQITITNAGTTYTPGDGIDIAAGVISIETATTTNLGGVTVGAGIEVNAGEITLGLMDGANIGGAKLGAGLEIVSDAIKVIYAGTGSANSSSRSDHTHTGYDNYVDWNLWVGSVKKLDVTAGEDVDFVGTANEIDVDYVDAGHKVRIGLPDTVTVTTGYKVGSFTGLTVLKEFQTQVGATTYDHAVTIKGGIITGWSIQPVA